MASTGDTLGRKETAAFLKISTRTLDRYVRAKKLNPIKKKGRLFFYTHELEALKEGQQVQTPHVVSKTVLTGNPGSFPHEENQGNEKYKILWEAVKEDIQEKNKIIFNLHHRLGFLEAELKHSIPLLESKTNAAESEKKSFQQQQKIIFLQQKLRHSMIGRRLFLILFIVTLTAGFLLLIHKGVILSSV